MRKPMMPQAPIKLDPGSAIAQGPFASVGARKRADTAAIFSNIGGLISQAQDRVYKQKVEKLQNDFETLSGAIQGYNEAQSSGNKAMMEHNANIINSIVLDPKKSKELSKAFDVNLNPMAQAKGKGQQKPNPAADAMKGAWVKDQQAFSAKQSMLTPQAQAMMRSMPQTLQPSPQYQQYLEGLKAGAYPKAGEELTFYKGIMDVQEKINNNQVTNATKAQIAQNLVQAMQNRTYMQQYGSILRTQMQQIGANARTEVMAQVMKYRADQALKGVMEHNKVISERLAKSSDPENAKLRTYLDGLYKQAEKNSKDQEDAKKTGNKKRVEQLQKESDDIQFKMAVANELAARRLQFTPEDLQSDPQHLGLSDEEFLLYQEALRDAVTPTPVEP